MQWIGRDEQAIPAYHDALDHGLPNPGDQIFALLQIAKMQRDREMWAPARDAYLKILKLKPEHAEASLQIGLLSIHLGDWLEARAALEKVLVRDSGNAMVIFHLARVLAASPDPLARDGLRALDMAAALDQAAPTPENAATVAMAHAALGDFTAAAQWQERSAERAEKAKRADLAEAMAGRVETYRRGRHWSPSFPDELLE